MAGICSALLLAASCEVCIIERQDRIGKKLLLTGNGRCNISNTEVSPEDYVCGDKERLGCILAAFGPQERDGFFEELGLYTQTVKGGIYPLSNQASSVLDALRFALTERGVQVKCGLTVTDINKEDLPDGKSLKRLKAGAGSPGLSPGAENEGGRYCLVTGGGVKSRLFDAVIIAGGGRAGVYGEEKQNAFSLAARLGHSVTASHPALCALRCGNDMAVTAGVRANARVSAGGYSEEGELQFTKEGLSGIPVFQLSLYLNGNEREAMVDLLPGFDSDVSYGDMMDRRLECFGDRNAEDFFAGLLNKKLAQELRRRIGMSATDSMSSLTPEKYERLKKLIRALPYDIKGTAGYKNAQVSAGGVPLAELTEGLGSRFAKGVWFAGEMLDVTGRCGGYNLHFAMASAFTCAADIKRSLDVQA